MVQPYGQPTHRAVSLTNCTRSHAFSWRASRTTTPDLHLGLVALRMPTPIRFRTSPRTRGGRDSLSGSSFITHFTTTNLSVGSRSGSSQSSHKLDPQGSGKRYDEQSACGRTQGMFVSVQYSMLGGVSGKIWMNLSAVPTCHRSSWSLWKA